MIVFFLDSCCPSKMDSRSVEKKRARKQIKREKKVQIEKEKLRLNDLLAGEEISLELDHDLDKKQRRMLHSHASLDLKPIYQGSGKFDHINTALLLHLFAFTYLIFSNFLIYSPNRRRSYTGCTQNER